MSTITPPSETGTLTKSITSGKWMAFGQVAQKSIGLISFFILARLLSPSDFGIMAIVLMIPNVLNAVSETGLSIAALQRGGNIYPYLDQIWTIGVIRGAVIALATFLGAPFIAHYLHAETATIAISLGGLIVLIYNFSNIGVIFFSKDLDFKKVFIRNISRDAAYTAVAVIIAFFYRSYWSLFIATIVSYAVQTIATYVLHPYRPKISVQFRRLKDLVGYSKWVVWQRWLDEIYGFLEPAVVARTTNISATGLYAKAKNMAAAAPGMLSPILNLVGFAAYAKIKDSPEKVRDGFLKSLDILFFFLVPVTTLIMFAGGKLILIFLGDQWLPMANTFRILLLFYLVSSIIDLSCVLLGALGFPDKKVKFDLIKMPLTIFLIIYLTITYGIVGAAAALLIGTLPIIVLVVHQLVKLTRLSYRDMVNTLWVPLALSFILIIPAFVLRDQLLQWSTTQLLLITPLPVMGYLLGIWAMGYYRGYGPWSTIRTIIATLRSSSV